MKAGRWVGFAIAAATLALAAPASAVPVLTKTVTAASAADKSCTDGERTGAGVARTGYVMAAGGSITARLTAASGDWDVAVVDSATHRVVAGSAYSGADEVAAGYAAQGSSLVVQACRLSGSASTARLTLDVTPIDTSTAQKAQLVRIATANLARKNELTHLGIDLTEHSGPGFVEAVLYGAADVSKLVNNNFAYTVAVPDLAAQSNRDRAADFRFAQANAASDMPSGRTTYRRLFDYSDDMKRLAREHPDLVRPITLNNKTY